MLYRLFVKRFLFFLNPELSHNFTLNLLKILFKLPLIKNVFEFFYCLSDKKLERNFFGLSFKNPVGLAAGFDKNAKVFNEFASFGFGFVEIGTVTPTAQSGNPKPRLFRLKKDQALVNRMGFNNDGIDRVVKRLKNKYANIIVGGNIGKNKSTPNASATSDYIKCFNKIAPYVDYVVLNVSSPNTPDLVELQNKLYLKDLLSKVQEVNKRKYNKPILVKISPDLSFSQIDEVLELVHEFKISGIIATNTSSKRDHLSTSKKTIDKIGVGGLSGRPIYNKSKKVVTHIKNKTRGKLPIIAVGGILTKKDAVDMLNVGASLVQIYTGFIYSGPSLVKEINKELLKS
jgi:dihydroorotate dehydrogenase